MVALAVHVSVQMVGHFSVQFNSKAHRRDVRSVRWGALLDQSVFWHEHNRLYRYILFASGLCRY